MPELEELQAKRAEIQSRIWEIERAENEAACRELIGKCFRFCNSYGSGDDWWLYVKIIDVEDGNLIAHRFETCSHGTMQAQPRTALWPHNLESGYTEIDASEFNAAWVEFKDTLAAL